MIIPSIDLAAGRAVQLVGGREQVLDAGPPEPWLERFSVVGEVAVVDLDAALGRGAQSPLVERLCRAGACRVGGGIRDYARAVRWLDAGAARIVLGTAASPDLLRRLPRDRVVVALDARDGEVVVDGWRTGTRRGVVERMRELRGLCGGFLVTFVEREGRLGGTDLDRAGELVAAAGEARVTIAGGITTPAEVAALDEMGADAQVGMALYTDQLGLADAWAAPLRSDRPDGLFPTIVTDTAGGALGLAWSSRSSLQRAIDERRGIYESRRRGMWVKGERSGATQELVRVEMDCDRDALRFTVRQHGPGFCHRGTATCWGERRGRAALEDTLRRRRRQAPAGSYSARLFADPRLLGEKLVEEARELGSAADRASVVEECADLWYFALVRLVGAGATTEEVDAVLDRRALRLTRRPGHAKPVPEELA